jgi:hypothetical protein
MMKIPMAMACRRPTTAKRRGLRGEPVAYRNDYDHIMRGDPAGRKIGVGSAPTDGITTRI